MKQTVKKEMLIIGFGSEILSDESIVAKLFQQLQKEFPEAEFKMYLALSLDNLIDVIGYDKLIFIDTVKSINGTPGLVNAYTIQNYQPTLHLNNMHDVSLPEFLKYGKLIDFDISDNVKIITIEISDFTTISKQLSALVQEKYNSICREIRQIIKSQIA